MDRLAREPAAMAPMYERLFALDSGGMGDVWVALKRGPSGFEKLVVVKSIRACFGAEPELVSLFLDEARVAARVNHPNVVQTLDAGHVNGVPFLAMELCEGTTYAQLIRAEATKLPLGVHLRVLFDVLAALAYVHELTDFDGRPLSIVHCDISPQNVMVTFSGASKLLDFGVARAAIAQKRRDRTVRGKCKYMSPEQAKGQPVDSRADVFCVGILLWEAVTGVRLWGRSSKPVQAQLVEDEIPDVREMKRELPAALAAVCARALAKKPEDRFASAREMARALEQACAGEITIATSEDVADRVARHFGARRQELARRVRVAIQSRRQTEQDDVVTVTAPPSDLLASGETLIPVDVALAEVAPSRPRPRWPSVALAVAAAFLPVLVHIGLARDAASRQATLAAAPAAALEAADAPILVATPASRAPEPPRSRAADPEPQPQPQQPPPARRREVAPEASVPVIVSAPVVRRAAPRVVAKPAPRASAPRTPAPPPPRERRDSVLEEANPYE